MYPELKEVAEIAKSLIGTAFPLTEEGMTVTQLATIVTENLGKKIKPEQVNQALVELGYQERNEEKRTWNLTDAGKEHGISLLATSATNSWSGVQVKWYRSVIPILLDYFPEQGDSSAAKESTTKSSSKGKKAWTIAERIKEQKLTSNPEQIQLIQSFADEFYLEQYGTKPPRLSGRKTPTSSYPSEAIEIVDRAIEKVFNPKKKSES